MAKLGINTGTTPNDDTGDSLLDGAVKVNSNFDEIYTLLGDGTTLSVGVVTAITAGTGINVSSASGDVTITNTGIAQTANIKADTVNVTGVVTATSFSGDGSGLTGLGGTANIKSDTVNVTGVITASSYQGSGVDLTGIVTSITAGTNITVSGSTGNVTINAGVADTSNVRTNTLTVSGVSTFSSDVSIGGTVSVDGVSTFGSDVSIGGSITVTGLSTSTFSSDVSIGGTVLVDGAINLTGINTSVTGTAGTAGEIKKIGGAPFYYDGAAWREFYLIDAVQVTNTPDTDWDNTIMRMTFDDSGDFDDIRFGATPTLIGSPTNVTAPVKIGTRSLRLSDNSDALKFPYRSEYDFTGEWTMEFWINFDSITNGTSYSNSNSFIAAARDSSTVNSISFGARGADSSSTLKFNFYWWNQRRSPNYIDLSEELTKSDYIGQWHHIALAKQPLDGSLHLYIDGVESGITTTSSVTDNSIYQDSDNTLNIGSFESGYGILSRLDASIDDLRISTVARYTSIGSSTSTTFSPPTTQLPITGSTTTVVIPPTDKRGEIVLGSSPTWVGTSGVTVTRPSGGNYRLTFTTPFTNADDYFVFANVMETTNSDPVGVGIARSTDHVDFNLEKQSDNSAIDIGNLSVQIIRY
jgi:hypothetical protein